MKFLFTILLFALFSFKAYALDLQQARSEKLVGENNKGYVEALQKSAEVSALVKEVNQKRLIEYKKISQENQQSVDVVAKLAHKQIVSKLGAGSMYQDAGGNWVAK